MSANRLYQTIAAKLRKLIEDGEYPSGSRLPGERELAERFGVSRTAVREAIKSLTEKGLIEVFVGRGTFVTNLSTDRVVESMTLLLRNEPHNVASLQEARELLEIPTARLAALRRTDAHVARLRAISAELEEEHSLSARLVDGDTEFHVELARATGNPVLVLLSQTIVALLRTERLYREDFDIARLPTALADHREIVDAVADADGDRAAQAMSEHLARVALPFSSSVRDHEMARVAS